MLLQQHNIESIANLILIWTYRCALPLANIQMQLIKPIATIQLTAFKNTKWLVFQSFYIIIYTYAIKQLQNKAKRIIFQLYVIILASLWRPLHLDVIPPRMHLPRAKRKAHKQGLILGNSYKGYIILCHSLCPP